MKEFNGWQFDDPKMRRRMKYIVVTDGDLDTNNAYAFSSKRELLRDLNDPYNKKLLAVFEVKDITAEVA